MSFIVKVKRQSVFGLIADFMMMPIIALCQFSLKESLQRTHFWNNQKLGSFEADRINESEGVKHPGDPAAEERWFMEFFPIFHIPALGGWKNYIVLEPEPEDEVWFPGWKADDVTGVSQVRVTGRVKLLLGPGKVTFFGIDRFGHQVPISLVGYGTLGERSPYKKVPLR